MGAWEYSALRAFTGLCFLFLAAACSSSGEGTIARAKAFQLGPVCTFDVVSFDGSMDTGRLNGCRQEDRGIFTLYIHPEDAPINPSSWYAFGVTSSQATRLDLTLAYAHGRHRYAPHISRDGGQTWQVVDSVEGAESDQASFSLAVSPGTTLVSAQPRENLEDRAEWIGRIANIPGVHRMRYGTSEQGRPLEALEFGTEGKPALVLIGGQHPPEVRGTMAMKSYVERLLEDDPIAREFRGEFCIVLAPVINPDGIADGNWRHNSRGVDLNRDWGPFTQAETRSFAQWIEGRITPIALLDFHGTWKSVLYTSPDESKGDLNWFPGAFHAGLAEVLGSQTPERMPGHNATGGVAKNWFHQTYAIPTMTYEVGDAVPLDSVQSTARQSAEITMRLLLQGPPVSSTPVQNGAIPE